MSIIACCQLWISNDEHISSLFIIPLLKSKELCYRISKFNSFTWTLCHVRYFGMTEEGCSYALCWLHSKVTLHRGPACLHLISPPIHHLTKKIFIHFYVSTVAFENKYFLGITITLLWIYPQTITRLFRYWMIIFWNWIWF